MQRHPGRNTVYISTTQFVTLFTIFTLNPTALYDTSSHNSKSLLHSLSQNFTKHWLLCFKALRYEEFLIPWSGTSISSLVEYILSQVRCNYEDATLQLNVPLVLILIPFPELQIVEVIFAPILDKKCWEIWQNRSL